MIEHSWQQQRHLKRAVPGDIAPGDAARPQLSAGGVFGGVFDCVHAEDRDFGGDFDGDFGGDSIFAMAFPRSANRDWTNLSSSRASFGSSTSLCSSMWTVLTSFRSSSCRLRADVTGDAGERGMAARLPLSCMSGLVSDTTGRFGCVRLSRSTWDRGDCATACWA